VCVAVVALGALAACGGDDEPATDPDRIVLAPADPSAGHPHASGGEGETLGDGTTPTVGNLSLTDVRLPRRTGEPGDLTFRVVDAAGEPVLDYTEEQTKLLHLYVVRNDLQDYRHLHPTLAEDGTWAVRTNLAGPGSYRVIAEFAPASDPEGRHVVLGRTEILPGTWAAQEVSTTTDGSDGVVEVVAPDTVPSGPDGLMTLTITGADGGAPTLGTYLGTYSHLTGFHVETGTFTHVHPLGEPEVSDDGTLLSFHTEFSQPGRYVFFVQVRVDGFVHTVPVSTTVT
jgi:hypothetical protein